MLEFLGCALNRIRDVHGVVVLWWVIFFWATGVAAVVAACVTVVEGHVDV